MNSLDTELVRTYFLNIPSVNTTIDEPHKLQLKKISHLQVLQPSIYLCMDHSDSSRYTISAIQVQHITYKYFYLPHKQTLRLTSSIDLNLIMLWQ